MSLGAATLLPGGSEAFFLYKLQQEPQLQYQFLGVATLGNTLGSCINYLLGRYLSELAISKSYFNHKSVQKAKNIFNRYGFISLLFSWMPIIGDPITFVAGLFRYSWMKFVLFVTVAKCLRYSFLLYLWMRI
ncbi:YqaA family protein [Sulfurospirillum sp. 1612]|uniref:YqaA family protein n=1 Tax=Sulfurospirillum sp. 1612 TaxID=3094835 RepID=UPI002F950EFE